MTLHINYSTLFGVWHNERNTECKRKCTSLRYIIATYDTNHS